MRLLADECVAGSTITALRQAGMDVVWIAETTPGICDREVLTQAHTDGRILLTEDKDFGELVTRFAYPCRGIVLLALASLPAAERCARAVAALTTLGARAADHIMVIEPRRIRLRSLRDNA